MNEQLSLDVKGIDSLCLSLEKIKKCMSSTEEQVKKSSNFINQLISKNFPKTFSFFSPSLKFQEEIENLQSALNVSAEDINFKNLLKEIDDKAKVSKQSQLDVAKMATTLAETGHTAAQIREEISKKIADETGNVGSGYTLFVSALERLAFTVLDKDFFELLDYILNHVAKIINSVTDWIQKSDTLKALIQQTLLLLMLLSPFFKLLSPMLMRIGLRLFTLVNGAGLLSRAFGLLRIIVMPVIHAIIAGVAALGWWIVLIIAAIIALGLAIYVYKNWDWIGPALEKQLEPILDFFNSVSDKAKETYNEIANSRVGRWLGLEPIVYEKRHIIEENEADFNKEEEHKKTLNALKAKNAKAREEHTETEKEEVLKEAKDSKDEGWLGKITNVFSPSSPEESPAPTNDISLLGLPTNDISSPALPANDVSSPALPSSSVSTQAIKVFFTIMSNDPHTKVLLDDNKSYTGEEIGMQGT